MRCACWDPGSSDGSDLFYLPMCLATLFHHLPHSPIICELCNNVCRQWVVPPWAILMRMFAAHPICWLISVGTTFATRTRNRLLMHPSTRLVKTTTCVTTLSKCLSDRGAQQGRTHSHGGDPSSHSPCAMCTLTGWGFAPSNGSYPAHPDFLVPGLFPSLFALMFTNVVHQYCA